MQNVQVETSHSHVILNQWPNLMWFNGVNFWASYISQLVNSYNYSHGVLHCAEICDTHHINPILYYKFTAMSPKVRLLTGLINMSPKISISLSYLFMLIHAYDLPDTPVTKFKNEIQLITTEKKCNAGVWVVLLRRLHALITLVSTCIILRFDMFGLVKFRRWHLNDICIYDIDLAMQGTATPASLLQETLNRIRAGETISVTNHTAMITTSGTEGTFYWHSINGIRTLTSHCIHSYLHIHVLTLTAITKPPWKLGREQFHPIVYQPFNPISNILTPRLCSFVIWLWVWWSLIESSCKRY